MKNPDDRHGMRPLAVGRAVPLGVGSLRASANQALASSRLRNNDVVMTGSHYRKSGRWQILECGFGRIVEVVLGGMLWSGSREL